MEIHPYAAKLQEEMITEIESAKPRFLVLVRNPLSWLSTKKSNTRIFYWFHSYAQAHYQIVAYADRVSPDSIVYVFGAQSRNYQPQTEFGVEVLQRVD
jgi:hypothetical protein